MDILIKLLQFILSLSLLVIVHEFGHFLFARIFKTRVEKFYLFFNPWFSLFKFRKGETEYGIGWIPFGGYVKISGMIDESMDTDQMKQPVQPYEFRAKPAWQRLLIMVGGVVMNIVLALLIYIGMSWAWGKTYLDNRNVKYGYAYGELAKRIGFRDGDRIVDINGKPLDDAANCADFAEPRIPFVVGRAVEGGEAAKAGFMAGDTLVSLNGEPMRYFDQYRRAFGQFKGDTVHVSVMRDSAGITKLLTLPVRVSDDGLIGVELTPPDRLLSLSTRNYTFWQAIPAGVRRTGEEIGSYAKQIKLMFTPETEAYKSLGGLIAIGSIFPDHWSWIQFWHITAFLSIVLAIMNILPIPALDGGHVLFLLVEVVTGRRPSDKFLERAQMAGLMILLALLIFANGNDIYRFFIK